MEVPARMVPSSPTKRRWRREPHLGGRGGVEDQVGPGHRQVEGLDVGLAPRPAWPAGRGTVKGGPRRARSCGSRPGRPGSASTLWPFQLSKVSATQNDGRSARTRMTTWLPSVAPDGRVERPGEAQEPADPGPAAGRCRRRAGSAAVRPPVDQGGRRGPAGCRRPASDGKTRRLDGVGGRQQGHHDHGHHGDRRPTATARPGPAGAARRPSTLHMAISPISPKSRPHDDVEAEGRVDRLGRGHGHQRGRAGQREPEVAARRARRRRGSPGSR